MTHPDSPDASSSTSPTAVSAPDSGAVEAPTATAQIEVSAPDSEQVDEQLDAEETPTLRKRTRKPPLVSKVKIRGADIMLPAEVPFAQLDRTPVSAADVRRLRSTLQLTTTQFGVLLGSSRQRVYVWETEGTASAHPTVSVLIRLYLAQLPPMEEPVEPMEEPVALIGEMFDERAADKHLADELLIDEHIARPAEITPESLVAWWSDRGLVELPISTTITWRMHEHLTRGELLYIQRARRIQEYDVEWGEGTLELDDGVRVACGWRCEGAALRDYQRYTLWVAPQDEDACLRWLVLRPASEGTDPVVRLMTALRLCYQLQRHRGVRTAEILGAELRAMGAELPRAYALRGEWIDRGMIPCERITALDALTWREALAEDDVTYEIAHGPGGLVGRVGSTRFGYEHWVHRDACDELLLAQAIAKASAANAHRPAPPTWRATLELALHHQPTPSREGLSDRRTARQVVSEQLASVSPDPAPALDGLVRETMWATSRAELPQPGHVTIRALRAADGERWNYALTVMSVSQPVRIGAEDASSLGGPLDGGWRCIAELRASTEDELRALDVPAWLKARVGQRAL